MRRFSTVRTTDRVPVVDTGVVVAEGTHEQLIRSNAYYRRLATTHPDQRAA